MIAYLILGGFLALFLAGVSAFVDVARQPADRFVPTGLSKGLTLVAVVMSGGAGGVYYWLVVRRRLAPQP